MYPLLIVKYCIALVWSCGIVVVEHKGSTGLGEGVILAAVAVFGVEIFGLVVC